MFDPESLLRKSSEIDVCAKDSIEVFADFYSSLSVNHNDTFAPIISNESLTNQFKLSKYL